MPRLGLSDKHAPVYAFNNGLWDTQHYIAPATASGLIPPDLQYPWLITENADYRSRAQPPEQGKLFGCVVRLHGWAASHGLVGAPTTKIWARAQSRTSVSFAHFGGASFVFCRPHQDS